MGKKGKKNNNRVVYSTNPNYEYEDDGFLEEETLPNEQQLLYISLDRKQRGGKEITLIEGFVGTNEDIKELGRRLKTACGVGGTAKNNEIIIQGNFRDKIINILNKEGYKTKRKGG